MTDSPIISIIVPVYNVEPYIRSCLDSIQMQSFCDFEVILVDDGSTDQSGVICDEYADKDNRFIVVHKQNEGVAKARITAFEHSKGNYITFIDSDDFVSERYLETMIKSVEKYHVDMVSCQYYVYEEGKTRKIERSVKGYLDRAEIGDLLQNRFLYDKKTRSAGIPVILCTKCVHRDFVLDALKMGLDLKWGEDQIALTHILFHINALYVVEDGLYYYVMHKGQTSKRYISERIPNLLEAYRRYALIDERGIMKDQLHLRTWFFSIKSVIFKMMPLSIHSYSAFVDEMKWIVNNSSWNYFFQEPSSGMGLKDNMMYWMLKYKLFRCFYLVYYRRLLADGRH